MVLEQIALLGIAGVDAYLVSAYLNAKKQAEGRARALSYQPLRQPSSSSGVPTYSAAVPGDSAVLSDRLAAIKSAVGETKFADEVLPYELGVLPPTSIPDSAWIEESSEEAVTESTSAVESNSTTSTDPSSSFEDKFYSHERKIQELNSEFAVLEYRVAEVERMLGVEKPQQKSEQIEIPLKPVFVQPVVVEKKTVHAKRKKKNAAKKVGGAKRKTAKKAAKHGSRKVSASRKVTAKSAAAVAKKAAKKTRKNVHAHKRRKSRSTTSRVEVVIKNQTAKKRRKPAKKRAAGKNRIEVVVKSASGKKVAVKKKRASKKAANRVEVVLKEPSRKVEVVPVSKEQKPAEKRGAADSKDHMDIEWKGSKIKLYSGESKD